VSGLLIIGAGGWGKVVADTVFKTERWDCISFLDDREDLKEVMGIPVIGKLNDYKLFKNEFEYGFVAIGNNNLRLYWLEKLYNGGFTIPVIVHPFSSVSEFSSLGLGTVVIAGTVVEPCAAIGKGCILNECCTIGHDCNLSDGVQISPGVHLAAGVNIGTCAWLCMGSNIINDITIGNGSIIASGAVVINDVPDNVMVAGIPAKIKKAKIINK
jgi:sugar O-acyltransferase (sialic acid O-acetyltransferase NeuD family)